MELRNERVILSGRLWITAEDFEMTIVFGVGLLSLMMLLGLLTLISTLVGQRLPQILAAIDDGIREQDRRSTTLHFAA